MATDWTDDELRATVGAYLDMRRLQEQGLPYSKAEVRRRLIKGPLSFRSEASIEFRMRNISAVLASRGQPIVQGYLPAKNVGDFVTQKLWDMLQEQFVTAGSGKMPPMIYFNIGWMDRYEGTAPDDPTRGGMGYLAEHHHGAESLNFLPTEDSRLLGYRPGHERRVNLERLGAMRDSDRLDNVLVIWMARHPTHNITTIVGWYMDATVYSHAQPQPRPVDGAAWPYTAETKVASGRLLPPFARTFRIESARTSPGGFGQNPVWYGTNEVNERVWRYVQGQSLAGVQAQGTKPAKKKPPINTDPELRRRVEQAAVNHAIAYFSSEAGGSCSVTSVEVYGRGWDLEATNATGTWLVEVKGLQESDLVCELTPNEYEKMNSVLNRDRYIVYVVNSALNYPISSIFRREMDGEWRTADGRILNIIEKTGAVLRCSRGASL